MFSPANSRNSGNSGAEGKDKGSAFAPKGKTLSSFGDPVYADPPSARSVRRYSGLRFFLARGDPHYLHGVADHVGWARLTSGPLGIRPDSSLRQAKVVPDVTLN
jgi:hypothetical protein